MRFSHELCNAVFQLQQIQLSPLSVGLSNPAISNKGTNDKWTDRM